MNYVTFFQILSRYSSHTLSTSHSFVMMTIVIRGEFRQCKLKNVVFKPLTKLMILGTFYDIKMRTCVYRCKNIQANTLSFVECKIQEPDVKVFENILIWRKWFILSFICLLLTLSALKYCEFMFWTPKQNDHVWHWM